MALPSLPPSVQAHNRHVFNEMFRRMFGDDAVPEQFDELMLDLDRTANTGAGALLHGAHAAIPAARGWTAGAPSLKWAHCLHGYTVALRFEQ